MPMGSRGIYGSGIDVSACPPMVEDRSLGQQKVLANHETIDKATTSTPQELGPTPRPCDRCHGISGHIAFRKSH